MFYKSKYKVKNPSKYKGDINNIICRSSWERAFCHYLDMNDDVILWNSEEVVIDYFCVTDKRFHKYFVDFYVMMKDGKEMLIEIKPHDQLLKPKKNSPKMETWKKNISKWKQAKIFAESHGMEFHVLTEKEFELLGIPILSKMKPMKRKR